MGPTAPGQSTLLFNTAGQAFSIPLHAAHLQQMSQTGPTTATAAAMFSPDGAQYFQPVTQLPTQATGQKTARTDRLEVCIRIVFIDILNHMFIFTSSTLITFLRARERKRVSVCCIKIAPLAR